MKLHVCQIILKSVCLYGICWRYRLVPYGNHSYLESLSDKSKELPLYSAGGIKFFWDTKYVVNLQLCLLIYFIHAILTAIFQLNLGQLVAHLILSHPFPVHSHRTGWNSLYRHGTSGCTVPHLFILTAIASAVWSRRFYWSDAFLVPQPMVSKHWKQIIFFQCFVSLSDIKGL